MTDYNKARHVCNQELFNITWRGLAAQGFKRSRNEAEELCVYRSADGRKCAAGHHIPDDVYVPAMERTTVTSMHEHLPRRVEVEGQPLINDDCKGFTQAQCDRALQWLGSYSADDIAELREHQRMHDNSWTPDEMRNEFLKFAERNNLTIPEAM